MTCRCSSGHWSLEGIGGKVDFVLCQIGLAFADIALEVTHEYKVPLFTHVARTLKSEVAANAPAQRPKRALAILSRRVFGLIGDAGDLRANAMSRDP